MQLDYTIVSRTAKLSEGATPVACAFFIGDAWPLPPSARIGVDMFWALTPALCTRLTLGMPVDAPPTLVLCDMLLFDTGEARMTHAYTSAEVASLVTPGGRVQVTITDGSMPADLQPARRRGYYTTAFPKTYQCILVTTDEKGNAVVCDPRSAPPSPLPGAGTTPVDISLLAAEVPATHIIRLGTACRKQLSPAWCSLLLAHTAHVRVFSIHWRTEDDESSLFLAASAGKRHLCASQSPISARDLRKYLFPPPAVLAGASTANWVTVQPSGRRKWEHGSVWSPVHLSGKTSSGRVCA
jgi:hypothetical protein